ncbi:MAG TPA: hypothetical protein VIX83_07880 [Candidatus Cybelea sp.]
MTNAEIEKYVGRMVAVQLGGGEMIMGKLITGEIFNAPYAMECANEQFRGLPDASMIEAVHPLG